MKKAKCITLIINSVALCPKIYKGIFNATTRYTSDKRLPLKKDIKAVAKDWKAVWNDFIDVLKIKNDK